LESASAHNFSAANCFESCRYLTAVRLFATPAEFCEKAEVENRTETQKTKTKETAFFDI
jgi:hypothetical protein